MAVNTVQTSFRVRTDATAAQGGTPTWAAAQNTNAAIVAGNKFRIRFAISNTGTTALGALTGFYLEYSKNGASYVALSTTGSEFISADATNGLSADGSAISTSLLTGTGTFSSGEYNSISGNGFTAIPNGNYTELELGLLFSSPACDGNTYACRIYFNGLPLNVYTVTPSFSMANYAVLAQTEANDTITAAGNVPRAALLNALEVSDNLTAAGTVTWPTGILAITEADDNLAGTAVATPVLGVLSATEANDGLIGSCFALPAGGAAARLTATEASDVLAGLGTGSGDVGSLSIREADDRLGGAAGPVVAAILNAIEDDDVLVSSTLLYADQWVESVGCPSSPWIQIAPGSSITFPPPVVPPPPPGEGEMLHMEQLVVSGINIIGNFSRQPNMDLCQITVDGRPFFPVGSSPDFTVSGNSVTWLNPVYSVVPGSIVIASYSWTQ